MKKINVGDEVVMNWGGSFGFQEGIITKITTNGVVTVEIEQDDMLELPVSIYEYKLSSIITESSESKLVGCYTKEAFFK